jgi:hypothetical protein
MYNPTAGTFTSRDSANNPPDPSEALNRYAYANDNPILNSDATGHFSTGCVVGGLIGTGAGVIFGGLLSAGGTALEPVGGTLAGATGGAQIGTLIGGAVGGAVGCQRGGGISSPGTTTGVAQPTLGYELNDVVSIISGTGTAPLTQPTITGGATQPAAPTAPGGTVAKITTPATHPSTQVHRSAPPAPHIKTPAPTLPAGPDLSWINPTIKPTPVPTALIPTTTIDLAGAAAAAIAAGTVFAVSNDDYAKQAAADPQIGTSTQAGHMPADASTTAAEHGDPECPPTGNIQTECVPQNAEPQQAAGGTTGGGTPDGPGTGVGPGSASINDPASQFTPSGVANLADNINMTTGDALDTAQEFLGDNYSEVDNGVFQSPADQNGLFNQVRMTDNDLVEDPRGAHLNFEQWQNSLRGSIRNFNYHVWLPEE